MVVAFVSSLASADPLLPGQDLLIPSVSSEMPSECEESTCTIVEVQVKKKMGSQADARIESCSKSVRVPKEVFDTINTFMRNIHSGSASGLPANLTPSQQTVLLMYATFLQQTNDFNCQK